MGKLEEESVVIKRDKVYSSYYSRACKIVPDFKLVAISIGIPDNFKGEILRELNPSESLLMRYKSGKMAEDEYEKVYRYETLQNLNPIEIYNKLKGRVILCYCGRGSFCHRQIVLKWLSESLGDEVVGGEI